MKNGKLLILCTFQIILGTFYFGGPLSGVVHFEEFVFGEYEKEYCVHATILMFEDSFYVISGVHLHIWII